MVHRQQVLSLYRGKFDFKLIWFANKHVRCEIPNFPFLELLRYGKTLRHTDKDYYQKRVKLEFVNNKELEEKDIPYVLKQGRVFLLSRNVI